MGNDGSNHTGADGNQDIVAINILPAVTGRWRLQATLMPVVDLVTFTTVFLRQWATLMEVIVMRLFVLRLAVLGSTLWRIVDQNGVSTTPPSTRKAAPDVAEESGEQTYTTILLTSSTLAAR